MALGKHDLRAGKVYQLPEYIRQRKGILPMNENHFLQGIVNQNSKHPALKALPPQCHAIHMAPHFPTLLDPGYGFP